MTTTLEKVYVVTETRSIQQTVMEKCDQEGLSCECFQTLDGLIKRLQTEEQPAVLMIDNDLTADEFSLLNWIEEYRASHTSGIIVMAENPTKKFSCRCLEAGADYCLEKPLDDAQSAAVGERLLYWYRQLNPQHRIFRNGDLVIDYDASTVHMKDTEVFLTPMEYRLLCILAQNVGNIVPHQQILKEIWGSSLESDITSLRAFMVSLRKKIEKNPRKPVYIQTRVGLGYRMNKLS